MTDVRKLIAQHNAAARDLAAAERSFAAISARGTNALQVAAGVPRLAEFARLGVHPEALRHLRAMQELGASVRGPMVELARQQEAVRRALEPLRGVADLGSIAGLHASLGIAALRDTQLQRDAVRAAEMASKLRLPELLACHRLDVPDLANRLVLGRLSHSFAAERWADPAFLSAFSGAAAMAQAVAGTGIVGLGVRDAMLSFSSLELPGLIGLRDYRGLLDAAGLRLPRWPRFRRLSEKEKRARQRRRLERHKQSAHVTRAKSLVHQHESYLREAIDGLMEDEYGPDWPDERLPLCDDGKGLLGRWRKRGGDVLDHADYPHYAAIMAQPDHFQAVFARGFADAATIEDLIGRARRLRANSHHPSHPFTAEDLRELRTTWNAIAKALRSLEADADLEWE